MPDTWCRFGGDCTTGTVLPLSQSQEVPEVFPLLSVSLFVSPLRFATQLPSLCKSRPLCWDQGDKVLKYDARHPFATHCSDLQRYFFRPQKITTGLKSIVSHFFKETEKINHPFMVTFVQNIRKVSSDAQLDVFLFNKKKRITFVITTIDIKTFPTLTSLIS